ncbi:hypothetical protein EK904_003868 [Melospiza melodia maxima]|nr:hypothetical protein EK904_003868 [Melospiza melodia maxima]
MPFSSSLCLFAQVCPLPPMVSHGDYICHPRPCERYNHGTVVEFYCDPGYTLANDYKYITCQYGEWFPSYQVYCVKTGKGLSYPNSPGFLQPLISEQICRGNQEGFMGDPDFVVVDGVPVMLPSYDEAVSSGLNALAPGYSAAADQGHILQTENQNPPAYPGPRIPDMQPSEFETCDSRLGSSELLQSLYPSLTCQTAALPSSDRTDVSHSTDGDAVSTSPRIDITDELEFSQDDYLPLDPHLCPHPQGDTLGWGVPPAFPATWTPWRTPQLPGLRPQDVFRTSRDKRPAMTMAGCSLCK